VQVGGKILGGSRISKLDDGKNLDGKPDVYPWTPVGGKRVFSIKKGIASMGKNQCNRTETPSPEEMLVDYHGMLQKKPQTASGGRNCWGEMDKGKCEETTIFVAGR